MSFFKIAVIGVGNIGTHHVRNLASFPNIKIVAIADTNEKTCIALSQKYKCIYYKNVDVLLFHEKPDAVVIAVPTRFHTTIGLKTLGKTIPTFIEKPIAANVKEAESLIKLAKKKKTILFIGHVERFNSAVIKAKKLIDDGKIGDIVSLLARRVGLFPPRSPDTNVVIDLAVHDIDIFSYLLDETPVNIYASGGKKLLKNYEDHAELFLRYPSGTTGYIQVSWITPVKIRTLSITGTRGFIDIDYINQTVQIVQNRFTDAIFDNYGQFVLKSQPTQKFLISEISEEPLRLELISFLGSVTRGKPAEIPGEVGLSALKIAEQAVQSMRQGNHI